MLGECECAPPRPDGGAGSLDAGLERFDASTLDGAVTLDASTPTDAATIPCVSDDDEWCDWGDNDCDGRIDEGHVCPDSTVAHTLPHDLTVWNTIRTSREDRARAIERLWPATEGGIIRTPYHRRFRFSPTGELFWGREWMGVMRYVGDGEHAEAPTPPCFATAVLMGFDAAGRMYYRCGGTVRRDNGELLGEVPTGESHVLSSGAFLHQGGHWQDVAIRAASGEAIAWFPLTEWTGELSPALTHTSVVGDSAFFPIYRTYRGGTRYEVVIYRADADGTFRLVRRIPIPRQFDSGIPLPDGTFVGNIRQDDDGGGVVMIFPPDGPSYVLREYGPEDELPFDGGYFAAPPSFER